MVYKIKFKKSVYKDLERFPKEEAKRILDKIDTELSLKMHILEGKTIYDKTIDSKKFNLVLATNL